jgi:hypothetical protein
VKASNVIFSSFLILALLAPGLYKVAIVLDFKINQELITELFCINKEEPLVMCSGKCYLSKQLEDSQDQDEERGPQSTQQGPDIPPFLFEMADLELSAPFSIEDRRIPFTNMFHTQPWVRSPIKPPPTHS